MFRLIYEMNGQTRVIDLPAGTHIIGRSRTCDVVIPNKSVSSQHVRIDVTGDGMRFRDLLSRNGTKVNGTKSEAGVLQPGDELKLGQVVLRVRTEDGVGDPTPPAVAAAENLSPKPEHFPAGGGDEPGGADEETPVDQNFLPATVPARPQNRAVQVVKPVAVKPAAGIRGGADRRKLLYAVGGFIAVILLALLLFPGQSSKPRRRRPRFSYWGNLHRGVNAFKQGDYAGALAAWDKAESGRKRYIPTSKNTAASTLARIVRPFVSFKQGKIVEVNWGEHIQAIHDLVDGGDLRYKEDKDFAAGPLMDACMREQAAQRTRKQADRLFDAGEYEAAKEQYAAVPRASIYHTGVDERIIACDRERVRLLRRKAIALQRGGDVQGAIAQLEKLDPALRTDADNRNLAKWRTDLAVKGLMREFKRLVASGNPQSWIRAQDVYNRLLRHRDHPAVIDLKGLKQRLDRKLYLRDVQNWYQQWNTAKLLAAGNNPLAAAPEARALINKSIRLQQEFTDAQKCIRNQNDLEGIEKAISHWNMVRRLEPNPAHPANIKAQQLTAQWPPEKRGEICKLRADEAFRNKNYRQARQYWEMAKNKYGIDTSAEIKALLKVGNRLFNRGNAERINKNYGEARRLYKQALDCYLPTERMSDKIRKTMELYHLDD